MTKENPLGGVIPTVGQTSKKKKSASVTGKGHSNEGKDENGCIRVPGFSGVWVNPMGKHFVKVDGKPLVNSHREVKVSIKDDSITLFDNVEEAAKMYDIVIKEKWGEKKKDLKLNFKSDGSRIIYDTTSTAAAGRNLEMLGKSPFMPSNELERHSIISQHSLFTFDGRWRCIKCKYLLMVTKFIIYKKYFSLTSNSLPIGGPSIICD